MAIAKLRTRDLAGRASSLATTRARRGAWEANRGIRFHPVSTLHSTIPPPLDAAPTTRSEAANARLGLVARPAQQPRGPAAVPGKQTAALDSITSRFYHTTVPPPFSAATTPEKKKKKNYKEIPTGETDLSIVLQDLDRRALCLFNKLASERPPSLWVKKFSPREFGHGPLGPFSGVSH